MTLHSTLSVEQNSWEIDGRTDGWAAGRGRGLELDCQHDLSQLLLAETLYRVVQLNSTPEIECHREY